MRRYLCLSMVLFVCGLAVGSEDESSSASPTPTEDVSTADGGETQPLWEVGLFAGLGRIPTYRGSDEYDIYALPVPYFIYRGRRLRSDKDGVRGIFLETERIETNVSFSGNPPVDDDTEAREGMPDLDPTVQVGPSGKYFLMPKGGEDKLYLIGAARAAFSIEIDGDFMPSYEGIEGDVSLVYVNKTLFERVGVRFGVNGGVRFGDSDFFGYYYNVPERLSTEDRQEFHCDGGYGGSTVSVNAVKEISKHFSTGGYVRWDNMSLTPFERSPLVTERNNVILGWALFWHAAQSKRMTVSTDEDKD